jgi:hypothetical protein
MDVASSSRRPAAAAARKRINRPDDESDINDEALPIPNLSTADLLALPRSARLNHLIALLDEKNRQLTKTGELGQLLTKQEAELHSLIRSLKVDGGAEDAEEAMVLNTLQERLEGYRDENEELIKNLAMLVSLSTDRRRLLGLILPFSCRRTPKSLSLELYAHPSCHQAQPAPHFLRFQLRPPHPIFLTRVPASTCTKAR